MVISYPWSFCTHGCFITTVISYPWFFCTHSHFVPILVVSYPCMVVSYLQLFCTHGCFVSSHFIPKFSHIHSFKISHMQAHEHMLIVVYDKLVGQSNQDPSKVLLCILATLLTQDKCDIFNEPVYCLHF